jgi:hypothetical protein
MDHRLALVIVPKGTDDPIAASRALLAPYQRLTIDVPDTRKFRYKRIGGWFDGLIRGEVGTERWSTVLRLLFSGEQTTARSPLPGYGAETVAEVEARIERENTMLVEAVWPDAPCSVIVTPDGEWIAHPTPDDLDGPMDAQATMRNEEWKQRLTAVLDRHGGHYTIAWDVSWGFIALDSNGPA